jgi:hypothetical protein
MDWKKIIVYIMLGLFLLSLVAYATAILSNNTQITRYFSKETTQGEPIHVSLLVNIDNNDKIVNYGIEEYVPDGYNISDVSPSDFYGVQGNKIMWIVNTSDITTYVEEMKVLTYTITPNGVPRGEFNGTAIFTSTYPDMRQEPLTTIKATESPKYAKYYGFSIRVPRTTFTYTAQNGEKQWYLYRSRNMITWTKIATLPDGEETSITLFQLFPIGFYKLRYE